jgi:nitrate/nitrite transporter NarK
MMFVGRHSDRTRERRWHVIVPNIVAAIGFLLCTQAGGNTGVALFGLVLAVAGVITGVAMFWALPTSFLGGNAAAAGIALINCTGNLGGFFSPTVIGFLKTRTGTLNSGLFLVAFCMIASSILILTLTSPRAASLQPTGAEI